MSECTCGLRQHIKKMIQKCKEGKSKLNSLTDQNIAQERWEYLDNLQTKLEFMLNHPESEQTV